MVTFCAYSSSNSLARPVPAPCKHFPRVGHRPCPGWFHSDDKGWNKDNPEQLRVPGASRLAKCQQLWRFLNIGCPSPCTLLIRFLAASLSRSAIRSQNTHTDERRVGAAWKYVCLFAIISISSPDYK